MHKVGISLIFVLAIGQIVANEIKKSMKNYDSDYVYADEGFLPTQNEPVNIANTQSSDEKYQKESYADVTIQSKLKNDNKIIDDGLDFETKSSTTNEIIKNFNTLNDTQSDIDRSNNAQYQADFQNVIMLKDGYYEFSINKLMLLEKQSTHNASVNYQIWLEHNDTQDLDGKKLFDSQDLFIMPNLTILKEYAKFKSNFLDDKTYLKKVLCKVEDKDCTNELINRKQYYKEDINLTNFPEASTTSFIIDSSNLCDDPAYNAIVKNVTNFSVKIKVQIQDNDTDYVSVLIWYLIQVVTTIVFTFVNLYQFEKYKEIKEKLDEELMFTDHHQIKKELNHSENQNITQNQTRSRGISQDMPRNN